jgi:hypothetical protein
VGFALIKLISDDKAMGTNPAREFIKPSPSR